MVTFYIYKTRPLSSGTLELTKLAEFKKINAIMIKVILVLPVTESVSVSQVILLKVPCDETNQQVQW